MSESDRSRLGLSGPPKVWASIPDYNPDHQPSHSAMYIEDRGGDIVWLLQVKGLGVIMLRALDSRTFVGMSEFTKAEIGYSPDL